MPKGNAIAAAVLASAGNPGTGGSGPSVAGGLSPLVASYSSQYSVNRPYSPLPRDPKVFLNGAFGPFEPVQPMPIDPPREDTGRPDPRRFTYPVGINLPVGEPGTEGGFRLVSYPVMRSLANYSVARSCIDKRKQEIVGLEWDIVATTEAEHAMADDDKARADWEKRRAKVVEFFSHPDSDRAKYPTFAAWLGALLEDRFVIDAVAVHLVPPRKKGAGPFGSDIASLDIIDGSQVKPVLTTLGATPKPPSIAWEIYSWGVPRVDMMSIITGADKDELDEPIATYRADQLIYMRETIRTNTYYGMSCIEKALLPIQMGLARQSFQNDFFTDGSVPAMFVIPGPDISTPQQIRQLQEALNAMSTDPSAKRRIIVLPQGSKAEPQKPVALADQFDEWVISQVSMPFGLTPMDLGVTPRVSAVQTPSESRELSQINSDKGSQTRIEPVCNDLKAVIFDFVIQDLFGQEDMEWSWGLTDRGKNRQAAIDQHIQLIGSGLESIDEGRTELGHTPWGLPETSVPLILTPTGPVPLQAVAGEVPQPGVAGVQPQAALPPAQGKPGQPQPHQPTDDELTTPAHEAAQDLPGTSSTGGKNNPAKAAPARDAPGKAADAAKKARQDAELEYLARHLRKGRTVAQFRADHLPAEALEAAERARPGGVRAAVEAAKSAAGAKRRQDRRDAQVAAAAVTVTAALGKLVAGHKQDKVSTAHVVDQAVGVMASGYASAMTAGSRDAAGDYEGTPEQDPDYIDGQAQDAAEGQRGYFTGLLQDIMGGLSIAMTTARLGLYAASLRTQYNASYGMTVMQAHPDYYIQWELGSNEFHCSPCLNRAGKQFTLDTLPGWPGDGGFGGGGIGGSGQGIGGAAAQENICAGGPACHCSCLFVQGGQVLSTGSNTQLPGATDYYAQQNATITAARQQAAAARADFVSSLPSGPALRAATRDELRQQVAGLANQRIRAAGGYQGVSVEPQDVPAKMIAAMLPPGMEGAAGVSSPRVDVAQAVEMMFAKASGVLDMTKAEFAAIVKGAVAEVAAQNAPEADPAKVHVQLARNYRPEGIGWVLSTPWRGPLPVPLDRIDWDHLGTWSASHDEAHVARFKADIKAGDPPRPVVMVQVPGSALLKVIDGHHRSLAYRELGEPVPAYVGLAGTDSPTAAMWRTHLYQVHSGGDPLNKALGDEDPSRVAFLLTRAVNGDGKWRYLLQKRADGVQNGGTWGLPGGRCHDGEVPWDAAVREAAEELGDLPDVTPSAVWTRLASDHVTWTYLVELSDLFAPSADGETSDETAGWGWFRKRDVPELDLHPAMADTWGALDFSDPLLGGTPVGAPVSPADSYLPAVTVAGWAFPAVAKVTGGFQDRGEASRQAAGIDGTAGDAQDAPHPFAPDAGGGSQACVTCGLGRVAGPHDTAECSCCAGAGEHPTGHECYRCDASGYLEGAERDRPRCEKVFRDPAAHADGCPHCGPARKLAAEMAVATERENEALRRQLADAAIDNIGAKNENVRLRAELEAETARKEAHGYDLSPLSGMISLDVPEGLIEPVPGGVTDSQHVTVVYLGKGLTDEALAEACRRAASAAALVAGPLDGVISGRGTFEPSESIDGKLVVWAAVTLPGAEVLREALEDLSASQFAQWSPHITRAYVDEGDDPPDPLPPVPVTFEYLSVHRSDGKVFRFTLGGNDAAGEPHQGDRSTCPCGTPVAYDEMNGWQHADGSISHDDGESVSDKMQRGC
jgi:8-oxo-dGTP pyrophosphatase MutT (NUDIX family)